MSPVLAGVARPRWPLIALILLLAAFAIRCAQFGNPAIHVDENFYLLVGDRMLHGVLPYVDIWDRKPIGLFLIYAGIRLLGGAGILQYQVVATLFAAGTAFLIARLAAPMTTRFGAVAAAILYLLLLEMNGGMGGQAPVFYNLFMAAAALAVWRVTVRPATAARLRRYGCLAMALAGVAMQVKYTALFEGVFFGILLLFASWRHNRSIGRLLGDGALWIGLALLPTVAAFAYYAARGDATAFIYANFLSIGGRSGATAGEALGRLGHTLLVVGAPLLAVLAAGLRRRWADDPAAAATFRFALGWLGAAVAGYLLFGTYFDHYALPLLVPIALCAAPLFGDRRRLVGYGSAAVLLVAGVAGSAAMMRRNTDRHGGAATMAAVVAAVQPRLTNCLFVWNGDVLLYYLTGSCLPSRYPFPPHLNLQRESGGIGIDPVVEVRRILANRPSVIVDTVQRHSSDINRASWAVVKAELARAYRPVAKVPTTRNVTIVYQRIPGR